MPTVDPSTIDDPRFDPESAEENLLARIEDGNEFEDAMDADEIQALITRSLEAAVSHYEENLEPDQVEATKYYRGEPFGDEQDGRSKVVSTDVGDATRAQMPSLMRIFFGPERVVEFRPDGPNDIAMARQVTDYINYIITEDNPGFMTLFAAFKDALVRRLGIVKWWYDESYRVEASEHTGLTQQELMVLSTDPSVTDYDVTGMTQLPADPMTGVGEVVYDVRVTRRHEEGCPRFAAVPPEEFVFTPNARSIESAPLVAHVREVPIDELVMLGIDPEVAEDAAGKSRASSSEDLESARRYDGGEDAFDVSEDDLDPSQRPVLFAEAYVLVDGDGDGVAELRLFQCVGPDYEIVNGDGMGEIVDELPFAVFTPEPEPHTIVGLSNFDLLRDVQRVKSQVLRGTLDSLALSLEPRTEVVVGEVNVGDLTSPEIGNIVRVTKPGMMREVGHSFVGGNTLPVLEHYDRIKEDRTGHTRAAQGLDADSLQSSTKAAVAATLTAGQQRIEMIARVFAETGMKRLFRGLLKLTVRHQNRTRMVRLRDEFVAVDPRHWNANMDVTVNIALGQGTTEEKIQLLSGVLQIQKELMQTGSPLVTNTELRYTLGRAVELAGFRHSEQFFKPWGEQEEAAMQQQKAQQPPPPDPATALVEIEKMKAQMQMQIDQQKLELEQWKAQQENDRERDKMAREFALKEREIEAKYMVDIEDRALHAQIDADRVRMDADIKREAAQVKAAAQAQAQAQQSGGQP